MALLAAPMPNRVTAITPTRPMTVPSVTRPPRPRALLRTQVIATGVPPPGPAAIIGAGRGGAEPVGNACGYRQLSTRAGGGRAGAPVRTYRTRRHGELAGVHGRDQEAVVRVGVEAVERVDRVPRAERLQWPVPLVGAPSRDDERRAAVARVGPSQRDGCPVVA